MSASAGSNKVVRETSSGGGYRMNELCADCANELDHCHGTLIIHREGIIECTEDGCVVLDTVRHDLIIDCESVTGVCGCAEPAMARSARCA